MSEQSQPCCWINGQLLAKADARISVFDHGLLYGDGIFEGIRFYNGRPFKLEQHIHRLFASAAALRIEIPYSRTQLREAVSRLIEQVQDDDGYLRLIVTRGEGPLGLDPDGCGRPNVIIIADQLALVSAKQQEEGIRVIIASTRRCPPDGLDPRVKSLNYLNHILARMEATHAGADEAILLNRAGRVTEASTENLFIVHEGRLITPPTVDGALEGITRSLIIKLAQALEVPVDEMAITSYDLYTADECFLTGTGAGLIPVRAVDGREMAYCPGEVFVKLNGGFQKMIQELS